MKIIAFAASNSRHSINKAFVTYAAEVLKSGLDTEASVEVLDLNDYEMPLFSVDIEEQIGEHEVARRFYEKIGTADFLLISLAEHNGHYPAFYKNLFDWTSRISREVYQNKPTIFFSVSPGSGGAKSVLQAAVKSAGYFGVDLRASLSIPSFNDNFDTEKGRLSNHELQSNLIAALAKLK